MLQNYSILQTIVTILIYQTLILSLFRTRNPDAMQTSTFELQDLMKPTKMLCKMTNYLDAIHGHIDVTNGEVDVSKIGLD